MADEKNDNIVNLEPLRVTIAEKTQEFQEGQIKNRQQNVSNNTKEQDRTLREAFQNRQDLEEKNRQDYLPGMDSETLQEWQKIIKRMQQQASQDEQYILNNQLNASKQQHEEGKQKQQNNLKAEESNGTPKRPNTPTSEKKGQKRKR